MGILETINDIATTASATKNISVLGSQVYQSTQNTINPTVQSVQAAVQQNVTNLGSNVLGVIEGVANTANTVINIGNLLGGFDNSGLGSLISDINSTIAQFNGDSYLPYTPGMASGGGGVGGGPSAGGGSQNVLADYAAYTYVITLSAGGTQILKSAGGDSEFFIDNLVIESNVGFTPETGNMFHTGFSFKVIEPYSMGRFFEAIQTAALDAGCQNYLEVPIDMTIEFIGHIDCNTLSVSLAPTKYFSMKIQEIDMAVNHQGAVYQVEAYPFDEHAFNTSYGTTKTDLTICCNEGGPYTVEDILIKAEKSLVNQINLKLKEEKTKQLVNTENDFKLNLMGPAAGASLGFDNFKKGPTPFTKDNVAYQNGIYNRQNLKIDHKNVEFKFNQGSSIADIINQVILTSEWSAQAETSGNQKVWMTILPKLENKGDIDLKTGIPPRTFTYSVEPYVVDTSAHQPVNMGSGSGKIVRSYYYIWTGKNKDILSFQIKFDDGFYIALSSDGNKEASNRTTNRTSSQAVEKTPYTSIPEPDGVPPPLIPETVRRDSISSKTRKNGGIPFEDNRSLAGKQFHDVVTRGSDMVELDLGIMGDPYFLGGRENGQFKYEDGEQCITIEFATPEGLGAECTGFVGTSDSTRRFCGIYRVLEVKSEFNKGRFTQTLSCSRQLGQDSGASGPSLTPPQPPNGSITK